MFVAPTTNILTKNRRTMNQRNTDYERARKCTIRRCIIGVATHVFCYKVGASFLSLKRYCFLYHSIRCSPSKAVTAGGCNRKPTSGDLKTAPTQEEPQQHSSLALSSLQTRNPNPRTASAWRPSTTAATALLFDNHVTSPRHRRAHCVNEQTPLQEENP